MSAAASFSSFPDVLPRMLSFWGLKQHCQCPFDKRAQRCSGLEGNTRQLLAGTGAVAPVSVGWVGVGAMSQSVRRYVLTISVAAITAVGAIYGAGLKTQQEHKKVGSLISFFLVFFFLSCSRHVSSSSNATKISTRYVFLPLPNRKLLHPETLRPPSCLEFARTLPSSLYLPSHPIFFPSVDPSFPHTRTYISPDRSAPSAPRPRPRSRSPSCRPRATSSPPAASSCSASSRRSRRGERGQKRMSSPLVVKPGRRERGDDEVVGFGLARMRG